MPVDLIFSNAAPQWLDDHRQLFPRLISFLRPGGVLAVQTGNNGRAVSHRLVGEIAPRDGPWAERLRTRFRPLPDLSMAAYYGWLAPFASSWTSGKPSTSTPWRGMSRFFHWTRSSTLLPALVHLGADEADAFVARYRVALRRAYRPEADGRTLFPFRQIFIVARGPGRERVREETP